MSLSELINKYGSDKNISGYTELYEKLFDQIKRNVTDILEIGIGSVDPEMPSSFCGIYQYFPHYMPGASLRVWRDYFPNAQVCGMDIDPKCDFIEDRITTVICSSMDLEACDRLLKSSTYDFILDDGLHTGEAQLKTIQNLFDRVKTGGYYIVEDCGGTAIADLFTNPERFNEFKKIANDHEYFLRGNVAFIKKNYSKRGLIDTFDEFIRDYNKPPVYDVTIPEVSIPEYKTIFSKIYDDYGFFGSQESRSGDGSTINATILIREKIKDLIYDKNIKTVVDIPCGDFNWMKEIVFNFDHYTGGDIVEKCIEENNDKYGSKRIEFIHFDLVTDKIPAGDLLIVRDVIGHFPLVDGEKIVKNIIDSNCKYLLATSWYDPTNENFYREHVNENVDYGRFYFLNLRSAPFNLPEPEMYIDEGVFYDGDGKRKGLGLWNLDKVRQWFTVPTVEEKIVVNKIIEPVDMDVLDIDIVSPTFHYIGQHKTGTQVVQIGAMDGLSYDDTRAFLDMYNWDALLVEPIPDMFAELKENFKTRTNYKFEQSAVTTHDGEVTMLTIPLDAIVKENLHPGYKGMSAIYPLKNGFGNEYHRDVEVKANHGVDISVPAITFNTLCEKHDIKKIDILICDAEGHDWIICDQLDFKKFRPSFVRFEYFNLTDDEKVLIVKKLKDNGYVVSIVNGQDVDGVDQSLWNEMGMISSLEKKVKIEGEFNIFDYVNKLTKEEKEELITFINKSPEIEVLNKDLTIVTGLWNINRTGRDFSHYIEHFKNFLDIPNYMFIYIQKEYEYLVWEKRSKKNTCVKIFELEDIKSLYDPFWNKTQEIRTDPTWLNSTGENGWLINSPQATLEYYNPIVQSKMFLLNDATIWNPFNNEYFIWLDAGITNTVYNKYLTEERALDKIIPYLSNFLFLSYPYDANDEIHGFNFKSMNRLANDVVKCVCRGGLFGGSKESINQANSTYYSTLNATLNNGLMGTEESVFSIMAYREPNTYRRYELDYNGMIVKFIEALLHDNVTLAPIDDRKISRPVTNHEISKLKTNLYILTFNFPQQVQHTIDSMEKTPEWLTKPNLILLDNSTNEEAKQGNREIAVKYKFEYIDLGGNTGICGGRQAAAEHFDASDADFMFFFEDDMTSNPPEFEGQFCRNGFRKYIPNLYELVHKIMLKENFDFLKLTFTEVFFDNDKQCCWYNVPQEVRTQYWPDYDKLPVSGLDPNVPLTEFKNIRVTDGLAYIDGDIYYANWPMIVSKEGNRKMFIDTKWGHPFEQTWMSHMFQLTKQGKLHPAVLLAAPIWHDRIKYYQNDERREN